MKHFVKRLLHKLANCLRSVPDLIESEIGQMGEIDSYWYPCETILYCPIKNERILHRRLRIMQMTRRKRGV